MAGVFILGASRTPIGGLIGALESVPAAKLAATAIRGAIAGIDPAMLDEVILGQVLAAGAGQAPARQAALAAGLAQTVPATAVAKVCGSGLRAVLDGVNRLRAGEAEMLVAGGMECMSRAPHLVPMHRKGHRFGHGQLLDHMLHDGLEDAYAPGTSMGQFAELCARNYGFSREVQDEQALHSLACARGAQASGAFTKEISPVLVEEKGGEKLVVQDEQPGLARPERVPLLKPAFAADGTVTAASSSSISDGAAALVIGTARRARQCGLLPRAEVMGAAGHAQDPAWFTTSPIFACRKLLNKLGWTAAEVDLWEVNEAFAVVALAFLAEMEIPRARLNIHGGACALGHPIGASGARILVTLLHALEARDLRRGIAAICIGGGEALAIAIERTAPCV